MVVAITTLVDPNFSIISIRSFNEFHAIRSDRSKKISLKSKKKKETKRNKRRREERKRNEKNWTTQGLIRGEKKLHVGEGVPAACRLSRRVMQVEEAVGRNNVIIWPVAWVKRRVPFHSESTGVRRVDDGPEGYKARGRKRKIMAR